MEVTCYKYPVIAKYNNLLYQNKTYIRVQLMTAICSLFSKSAHGG